MISMDALVLEASRNLPWINRRGDAHLNSALAGAAYKIGIQLTEDLAREGLVKLKKAESKARRIQ